MINLKKKQEKLGCKDCSFCSDRLYKKEHGCCGYSSVIRINLETGECLTRRNK